MGVPEINPAENNGTYIDSADWNKLIKNQNTIVIDTRNHYEVSIGTFQNSINPNTRNFSEFPKWVDDHLDTHLENKESTNIAMFCTGGIIGLGETNDDRASLLEVLSNMNPHPESVPINSLVAIEGTGLEDNQEIDSIEMIRMIATARILMPKSKIRLSAGREKLTKEAQILCFQCGANSIFYGDELLTTSNPSFQSDRKLLKEVGVSFNKDFETSEKTLSSL